MDGFSGGGHYCIDKGMVEWIGRHIIGGGVDGRWDEGTNGD